MALNAGAPPVAKADEQVAKDASNPLMNPAGTTPWAAYFGEPAFGMFDLTLTGTSANGTALTVSITVTNSGTSTGATTCRVTDPKDRNGGIGAIVRHRAIDQTARLAAG